MHSLLIIISLKNFRVCRVFFFRTNVWFLLPLSSYWNWSGFFACYVLFLVLLCEFYVCLLCYDLFLFCNDNDFLAELKKSFRASWLWFENSLLCCEGSRSYLWFCCQACNSVISDVLALTCGITLNFQESQNDWSWKGSLEVIFSVFVFSVVNLF